MGLLDMGFIGGATELWTGDGAGVFAVFPGLGGNLGRVNDAAPAPTAALCNTCPVHRMHIAVSLFQPAIIAEFQSNLLEY